MRENDSGRVQRKAVRVVRDGPSDVVHCSRRTLRRSAKNAYQIGVTHRLLHMRTSFARICIQPRCHPIYIGFSSILNYVIKRGLFRGHRYGKTPEKKEHHQAHNLKKEMHQEAFQKGSTIVSGGILHLVQLCWNLNEMKKFV